MTPADYLRAAADACDNYALGRRQEIAVILVALHVLRLCGTGAREDEAKLLIELLGD